MARPRRGRARRPAAGRAGAVHVAAVGDADDHLLPRVAPLGERDGALHQPRLLVRLGGDHLLRQLRAVARPPGLDAQRLQHADPHRPRAGVIQQRRPQLRRADAPGEEVEPLLQPACAWPPPAPARRRSSASTCKRPPPAAGSTSPARGRRAPARAGRTTPSSRDLVRGVRPTSRTSAAPSSSGARACPPAPRAGAPPAPRAVGPLAAEDAQLGDGAALGVSMAA
jgi:hypothetical protein